jgi:competence protein ComEA
MFDLDRLRDVLEDDRRFGASWRWLLVAPLVAWLVASLVVQHPIGLPSMSSTGTASSASAIPTVTSTTPSSASSTTVASEWMVQVSGAVARAGVYRIAANARVGDAIELAGGLADDADVDAVNMAQRVSDAQYIYVPRHGQTSLPPAVTSSAASGSASSPSDGSVNEVVDVNHATTAQLEALPGVGPATAAAIADYRAQHGPFRSIDDLGKVKGIGQAKLEQLRPHVRV